MAQKKDEVLSKRLQNNIRFLRDSKGLTITELAEKLGCSRDDIANWENRFTPKLPDLVALCDFFKITIDDIIRKDLSKVMFSLIQKGNEPKDDWKTKYLLLLEKYTKILETQE